MSCQDCAHPSGGTHRHTVVPNVFRVVFGQPERPRVRGLADDERRIGQHGLTDLVISQLWHGNRRAGVLFVGRSRRNRDHCRDRPRVRIPLVCIGCCCS